MSKISFEDFLTKKATAKIDLGNSLIHFIAQDTVNKLDTEDQVITGYDLSEYIDASEFIVERARAGYGTTKGEDWAMVSLIIGGAPFFKAMKINTISQLANIYTEARLYTGNLVRVEDSNFNEIIRFRLVDGKVIKDMGYLSDGQYVVSDAEPIIYPGNWIPVRRIRNNAQETGDIAGITATIKELNKYSNEFRKEWNKAKLQFGNNKMFGSQKSATDWQKMLDSGLDVHDFSDPDGTLQLPISQITGIVATVQHLLLQFNFMEDKALKYSFTMRDTTSSGTNKQTLEVATFNQSAFEYLLQKQKMRELDYKKFFRCVLDQLNEPIEVIKGMTVSNPISEIEMMKLELNRAKVAQAQAQAKQMSNQGDLYLAQAEVVGVSPEGEQ